MKHLQYEKLNVTGQLSFCLKSLSLSLWTVAVGRGGDGDVGSV